MSSSIAQWFIILFCLKLIHISQQEDPNNSFQVNNIVGDNSIVIDAVPAVCKPYMEVVELETPPNTVYLPSCVQLQRCHGCCNNKLLSCQPTITQEVKLKVMELNKRSDCRNRRRGRHTCNHVKHKMVDQVNHVECSCQCRIQEHHCNKDIQEYNASQCSCVCKNRDKEAECISKSSTHKWDSETCSCQCIQEHHCNKDIQEYMEHNPWLHGKNEGKCGPSHPLPDGSPAQCNPRSKFPCCSITGWCGRRPVHCICDGCIDYRTIYLTTESELSTSEPASSTTIEPDMCPGDFISVGLECFSLTQHRPAQPSPVQPSPPQPYTAHPSLTSRGYVSWRLHQCGLRMFLGGSREAQLE